MNAATVDKQVNELVGILTQQARLKEAEAVQAIYAKRFIWDQMALKLIAYLQVLAEENLSPETKEQASQLRATLQSVVPDLYDRLIYTPARQLAEEIENSGFPGWRDVIREEIGRGFTSGEIFDGLRHLFNRFLNETAQVPTTLQRKVRQFLSLLDQK